MDIYERKLMLVDDNQELLEMIADILRHSGYKNIVKAKCVQEALTVFQMEKPDMAVLDVMLPDGDGFQLFQKLRENSEIPILFLSARDEDRDRLFGLGLGADDYITKPFSLMALVSKVNALMRRLSKVQAQIMSSGEITVHMKTMQVYKGDEPVTLSKKEFSLLLYLWENAGQIVSKESILEHVWDIDGQFVDDNTVTVNISRLKNKLGTEEIANVRGLGYIWTGKVNKN